jgi:tRNA pseudouridine38-40 synthase
VRVKLTLEYDGTGFRGWAAQPGLRTVESVVGAAVASVFPKQSALAVAGRTDTGVHALANVVSLEVEGGPKVERIPEALNAVLPDDVAVTAAEHAPDDFHARHSARSRAYRYRIWRPRTRSAFEHRRSWWVSHPLDLAGLRAAASSLIGEHDFRAFTPTETQHEVFRRNVFGADWHDRGETLEFEITADSFLRHMVRTLVGSMVDGVDISPLLDGRPRSNAGQTAPPWGLYLVSVGYERTGRRPDAEGVGSSAARPI